MKILNNKWFMILLSAASLCGLFAISDAIALPYQPPAPIVIVSGEVGTGANLNDTSLIEWTAVSGNSGGDSSLSFHLAGINQLICRLFLTGKSPRIEWNNTTLSPQTILEENLLIVPGSNVPCDILPVGRMLQGNGSIVFEIRHSFGGEVLIDRIQIDSITISPQDAMQNGWIADNATLADPLVMIKAVNLRTNTLLVQQLWVPGNDWWIYEETPTRQSWRVGYDLRK